MDKVIRDGKVAVAISRGFGAGWTTWNKDISPFEPKVITMIEANRQGEITREWCEENLNITGAYCGGADELEIEWLPVGEKFYIHEYDGSESIVTGDDLIQTA